MAKSKVLTKVIFGFLGSIALGPKVQAAVDHGEALSKTNLSELRLNSYGYQLSMRGEQTIAALLEKRDAQMLSESVFTLNDNGEIEIIATKSEIEALKKEILKMRLHQMSAGRVTPSTTF